MAASRADRVGPWSSGVEVDGDVDPMVVWLWGDHDSSTADSVTSAILQADAGADPCVVVDLSEVTFMDASTLGAFVRSRQILEVSGRRLRLRSPHPGQRRLLEICDLADLIDAEPSGAARNAQSARSALETWIEVPSAEPRLVAEDSPSSEHPFDDTDGQGRPAPVRTPPATSSDRDD